MEIKEIVDMQVELDEASGFPVKFADLRTQYDQLTKDLVGLVGEIGEFSNIVKKMNIKLARPDEYELDLAAAQESLREELIDSFIYILRIGAILEVDFERAALEKIRLNRARYAKLARK